MTALSAKQVGDIMKKEVPALLHERIAELELMLEKKLDLIRRGIGGNYRGDPFENKEYTEVVDLLNKK